MSNKKIYVGNISFDTTYDDLDDNLDTDRDSEDLIGTKETKRGPVINMFSVSKKSRSVYLP